MSFDVNTYIESGIIERYLLGDCSPGEVKELLQLAAQYPEIQRELELTQATFESFSSTNKSDLLNDVRLNLMEEISKSETPNQIAPLTVTKENGRRNFFKYAAAAAFVLFLLSISWNVVLVNKNKSLTKQLDESSKENIYFADQLKIQKASLQKYNDDFRILTSLTTKTVELKGLEISPEASARVYWDEKASEVYLNVASLPLPPKGKQYQLWALHDGKPIDAGVFDVNTEAGLQKMKTISKAQAFAVTLEEEGGSPVPHTEAMYLLGTI